MRATRLIAAAALAACLSLAAAHPADAKPKPKPPFPTYHINEMWVTITKVAVVRLPSDANDTQHAYLVLWLAMQNHNDVIVRFDPQAFSLVDQLQQPTTAVDECDTEYLSSAASEQTRLAAAFYPRLCSTPSAQNNDLVNPSQRIAGSIAFTIPTGQHRADLTWAPSGSMDSSITFPTKTWTILHR